jgi:hypothetical protein
VRRQLVIELVDTVDEVFEVALTAPLAKPSAEGVPERESLEPELTDESPVAGESIAH